MIKIDIPGRNIITIRSLALADIITLSITDALDLLIYTDRIRATLRS